VVGDRAATDGRRLWAAGGVKTGWWWRIRLWLFGLNRRYGVRAWKEDIWLGVV